MFIKQLENNNIACLLTIFYFVVFQNACEDTFNKKTVSGLYICTVGLIEHGRYEIKQDYEKLCHLRINISEHKKLHVISSASM